MYLPSIHLIDLTVSEIQFRQDLKVRVNAARSHYDAAHLQPILLLSINPLHGFHDAAQTRSLRSGLLR